MNTLGILVIGLAAIGLEPCHVPAPTKAGFMLVAPNVVINDAAPEPEKCILGRDPPSRCLVERSSQCSLKWHFLTKCFHQQSFTSTNNIIKFWFSVTDIAEFHCQHRGMTDFCSNFFDESWRFAEILEMELHGRTQSFFSQCRPIILVHVLLNYFVKIPTVHNQEKPCPLGANQSISGLFSRFCGQTSNFVSTDKKENLNTGDQYQRASENGKPQGISGNSIIRALGLKNLVGFLFGALFAAAYCWLIWRWQR